MVVVDDLDEGLDLGALLLAGLRHAAGDLGRVTLDTGNDGVAVGVSLVTRVDGLDDDDLKESSQSANLILLCVFLSRKNNSDIPCAQDVTREEIESFAN